MSTALDARLCLIDYLHRSPKGRSVHEILDHLHVHTAWGHDQIAGNSSDRGLRTVQSWLKQLRDSNEFGARIDATVDPQNRRRLLYRMRPDTTRREGLAIEEALLLVLAAQNLDLVIPAEFRAGSLDALFRQARKTIEHYERNLATRRPAVGKYLESVAVRPRGQSLEVRLSPYPAFATLSSALLHRQCVQATYHGRQRLLHPLALVVRTPKLYLIASEDDSTAPDPTAAKTPKTYAVHRLRDIVPLNASSRIEDFDLQAFIDEEGLEVPLQPLPGDTQERTIDLMLHIHSGPGTHEDELLRDLDAHPIDPRQRLTRAGDGSHHILGVNDIVATEALVNWIVGRMDRIEVVSPAWLRRLLATRVASAHKRYQA